MRLASRCKNSWYAHGRPCAVYEWVHHVRLAWEYDIAPDDITAIANGGACPTWTVPERDLITAVDEMLDDYRISDHTWRRLAERFNDKQLVEMPFVVGTYTCLAMAFNS